MNAELIYISYRNLPVNWEVEFILSDHKDPIRYGAKSKEDEDLVEDVYQVTALYHALDFYLLKEMVRLSAGVNH